MWRYVYELCTTYDELYTRIVRVKMISDDFGYKYPLNGTYMRKKGRFLNQSHDKSPYIIEIQKSRDNIKTPQKLRLHNDCGPSKDRQLEYTLPSNWCG